MNIKKTQFLISVAVIAAIAASFYFLIRSQPQGYIKIDAENTRMQLHNGRLFGRTRISSGDKPVKVKALTYKPKWLQIESRKGPDTWRIQSSGPWGDISIIEVIENEITNLELGPPLYIETDVRHKSRMVSIGFSIIGSAGEKYYTHVIKNGKPLPAPEIKIVDEAGKVLESGSFEYG